MNHTTVAQATADPIAIAIDRFEHIARGWNRGDGAAIGEVFADDTEFVNIRGEHIRGDGDVIARGHQEILDTIYAGSRVAYRVDVARVLVPGCVVAVVTSTLDAPSGPLRGVNQSRITAVITEQHGRWVISGFHNTLVLAS
jgi:uncharacterized protein (TIGR02246 family)